MATGAPGTNGVWQYGEDDSEATFSALLNKVASTTNTQIGTDRGRLTTLEARALSGLVPVVPSSVVVANGSASVTAVGQVTFTGTSAVSLNSVFSSTYRNYRLVLNVPSSTADTGITYRYRTGSTDNSTSNYYAYQTYKRTTGVIQDNSGGPGTSGSLFSRLAAQSWGSWSGDIFYPNNSITTQLNGVGFGGDATSSWTVWNSSMFNATTVFDGITFFANTGTMTGTVQIFGYND